MTDVSPPLRVAIVGAGMIGRIHARAARLCGADVVGLLDADLGAAARAAVSWRVSRVYDGLDALLADGLDVIHICSPNATHGSYARSVIEGGLHVICEKPLGISAAEGRGLAELAAARGVVAAVPFTYRYHPLVREIRARANAGEFGRWLLIHGSYLQDWLLEPDSSSWRVDPTLGGPSRAFADIGSHWCDLIEWVSRERISEVCADSAVAIARRPIAFGTTFEESPTARGSLRNVATEDIMTVLARTAANTPVALAVSQVSAGRKNRLWFELDGSAGSAVFDQELPDTVWLGGVDESRLLARYPRLGIVLRALRRRCVLRRPGLASRRNADFWRWCSLDGDRRRCPGIRADAEVGLRQGLGPCC
jgi:predicted dehydrogenase